MFRSHPTLDFHEKQRARRRLYSPLTFVALAILIVIVARGAWGMYQKSRHTDAMLQKSKDGYSELSERQEFLNTKLAQLSTEAGVESEVRERFGVAKPGEEVIVVLSEEEADTATPETKSWWARFKEWLAGTNDDYIKGE